ncbi:MAG: PQQ-dependent sugar dehydrogenase, partial [Verrucomicrobiales bacterium]
REEIWAFGLRNPWRASVDRETGDLWIGDVGQSAREEIDVIPAGQGGLNFGWRPREGFIQTPAYPNENPVTPKTDPVFDYGRNAGISVTGGYVYRGKAIPGLVGTYIIADFGTARFWALNYDGTVPANSREITSQLNPGSSATRPVRNISSFGEDDAGELYVCDHTDGEIYRIVSAVEPVRISAVSMDDNELSFSFNAAAGVSYVVEGRDSLDPTATWEIIEEPLVATSPMQVSVTVEMTEAQQFIRIRTK